MSEMDVFAAMGIAGFGKQSKKHELKPDRFDKTKRTEARPYKPLYPHISTHRSNIL
jgi:WD repeat-containing protein 70